MAKKEKEIFVISPESSIGALMTMLNKEYGDETMVFGSEVINGPVIETGNFGLDYALNGGVFEGRFNVFVGNEHSGKTTSAIKTMGNLLNKHKKQDSVIAYGDFEGGFDGEWAYNLGADTNRFLLLQPPTAEVGIDALVACAHQTEVKAIVVDSLPAMVTNNTMIKTAYEGGFPETAAKISRFLSVLNGIAIKRRSEGNPLTVILITHLSEKVGIPYGDPTVILGGRAPKRFASSIVSFSKSKEIELKDDVGLGYVSHNEHSFKIIKARTNAHVKSGDFRMNRDPNGKLPIGAIDDYSVVIKYAKQFNLLVGHKLDEVDEKFKLDSDIIDYLIENDDQYRLLKAKIIIQRRLQFDMSPLPPDGYLYGWHTEDAIEDEINKVEESGENKDGASENQITETD